MDSLDPRAAAFRFGAFEMDIKAGELRQSGRVVSLPPQPFKVLALLVRRAGEVVSREEIRQEIWGDQTVVDFERGLNFAINKIRSALGDSAGAAIYIETLPRRGYRFLSPVEASPADAGVEPATPRRRNRGRVATFASLAVAALLGVAAYVNWPHERSGAIRSIAVLPFENLSHAAGDDYLSDGTTDALTTELGRVTALRVTSKTSSAQYRKPVKMVREIARELKVDAIVEGAVLRSGDRLRVSVQLIEAEGDRQIWSETYERRIGDVLTLQGEIARSVAGAIRVRVTPEQRLELSRPRPVDPEAYQSYVRGRFYWNRVTADGSHHAIDDFQQAIAHDPRFSQAYAGLADAYAELPVSVGTPAADAYSEAGRVADRALAIDPDLVEAVNVRAEVAAYSWNWSEAARLFQRVFELNPSYAQAYHDYGFYLLAMNRVKDAIAWNQKACMLDPLSSYFAADLAMDPYWLRNYDEALLQMNRVLAMDPQFATTHMNLAYIYAAKGDFDRAIPAAKRSRELDPQNPFMVSTLAYVYGKAGQPEDAQHVLDQLSAMARTHPVSAYHFAFAHLGLGHRQQSMDFFMKAYDERFYALAAINIMPDVDSLRSDPRFGQLLRLMGVPQ